MDFLKNINKEFYLTDLDFIKKNYHYLFEGDDKIVTNVKAKVSDIDMRTVYLTITEIEGIDDIVAQVADLMTRRITEDAEKFKVIAKKVVEAWEKSPESFKRQKDTYHKDTYKNKGLLTNDEYHQSVFTFLDKISFHSDFSFTTGCGGDTFYDKEFHVKCLEDIDAWVTDVAKQLSSTKIRARIKNALLKNTITISLSKVNETLTLAEKSKPTEKKPPFPIKLSGNEMNALMRYASDSYITEEIIEELDEEWEIDISSLLDWEISSEHEGEHYNDGQICDYTVTLTSPDGHEYYAYDSHCLMTGWNFDGDDVEFN